MEKRKFHAWSDSSYDSKVLLINQTPQAYAEITTLYSTVDFVSNDSRYSPWNNPDNIISHEMYLLIEHALLCYATPVFFLIGVPANFLSCLVFYRQGLQDRMNLCLFCLAFVDMLFIALFYAMSSHCMLGNVDTEIINWWKLITRKYLTGLYRGFLFSSGCLTMIISVERCVCVFLPMKAVAMVKTSTMGALITVTILTLQILCLMYPMQLEVVQIQDASTNTSTFVLHSTQLYRDNSVAFDILENIVIMTVIPFFTFTIVVMATILTVIQLKRAIVWRTVASSSANTKKERGLVTMLVTVNCVFIVTASPNIALGLARILVHEFWFTRRYANIFLATHGGYIGLGMLNSSINFFVYIIRSSRFRQELRGLPLFGLCMAKKRRSTSLSLSANTSTLVPTDTLVD